MAKTIGVSSLILHNDSQVVVGHINEDYKAKGEWMKKYLNLIKRWTSQAFAVEFIQVLRKENEHTDQLAKATSAKHMMVDRQVLSFIQQSPAIEELKI